MSFLSEFQAALDEATAILTSGSPTATFNYKGTDYVAVINDIELSNNLEPGGFLEDLTTVIIVSKTVLATAPVSGETLYIGTKKVRIERVKSDEVSFEIHGKTAVR